MSRRLFVYWLGAIAVVAGLLRFFHLGSQCLWIDEVWTYDLSQNVVPQGLRALSRKDAVAPLSFLITAAVSQLGLSPVLTLRVPSAILGTLAVILTGLLGRKMFRSEAAGLAAAALAAISPFAIWFAQDGRMYAMVMFLSVLFVWVFWDMLEDTPRPWHWITLTLVMIVMVYNHQLGPAVSIACGFYLLLRVGLLDRRLWLYAASQACAALSFVPWILLGYERIVGHKAGFPKGDSAMWVPYTIFAEIFGFSFGPSVRELRGGAMAALGAHLPWILLPTLGAAWIGGLGLRRALRGDHAEAGRFCFIWITVPIALVVAASFTGNVSYHVRYVCGVYPAVALLLACGLLEARRSPIAGLASALLLGGMVISLSQWYASDNDYAKEESRGAAAVLAREYRSGDLVIYSSATGEGPLTFYGFAPPADAMFVPINSGGGRSETLEKVLRTLEEIRTTTPGRRVWLVETRAWESDPGGRLRRWLVDHGRAIDHQAWPGLELRLFQIPSESIGSADPKLEA